MNQSANTNARVVVFFACVFVRALRTNGRLGVGVGGGGNALAPHRNIASAAIIYRPPDAHGEFAYLKRSHVSRSHARTRTHGMHVRTHARCVERMWSMNMFVRPGLRNVRCVRSSAPRSSLSAFWCAFVMRIARSFSLFVSNPLSICGQAVVLSAWNADKTAFCVPDTTGVLVCGVPHCFSRDIYTYSMYTPTMVCY